MNITTLCIFIVVIFIVFVIGEIVSYGWHRYLAHKTSLSGLLPLDELIETHKLHHNGDESHDATEDFLWILYVLIILLVGLGVLCLLGFFNFANKWVMLCIILTIVFAFFVNWYVHLAVHTNDHWLQRFDYIKELQNIHFVHHENDSVNYSITGFIDDLFATYGPK